MDQVDVIVFILVPPLSLSVSDVLMLKIRKENISAFVSLNFDKIFVCCGNLHKEERERENMMHVPLLQVEDCAPFSGHRQLEAASSGGGNGGTCHVPPPSASPPPPVHSTSGCHLWNRVYFKLEFKSLPFPPCRSTTPPYFFFLLESASVSYRIETCPCSCPYPWIRRLSCVASSSSSSGCGGIKNRTL